MDDAAPSPDYVIDPRWNSYLSVDHGTNGTHPARTAGKLSAYELSAQMRAIVGPWEAGEREPYETLEALRHLADRVL